MNKLSIGFLSIALLTLGACSTEVDDTTQSVRYTTVNLITPLDGSDAYATEGAYTFDLNLTRLYGTVSTSNLKIGNKEYSFTTDTVSTLNYTGMYGFFIQFNNVQGYLNSDKSLPLTNANFHITSLFYYPETSVPGYSEKQENMPYIIGQYTAGDWYVVTMQRDATYVGTTTTSYLDIDGSAQSYENTGMYYRLIFDIDNNTVDVIIYQAKFASAAPQLTGILLKNLPVTFRNGAFSIDAENVIPSIIEGSSWTELPSYVFNTFSLSSTNTSLTKIRMNYTVAGSYHGTFEGACVLEVASGN